MARAIVCGGRDYDDRERVFAVLDRAREKLGVDFVITGGCKTGADSLAGQWAKDRGIAVAAFSADWDAHGKAAGPIRNRRMIEVGEPDLVIAFPGGRGTADMIAAAREAGIPVHEIPPRKPAAPPEPERKPDPVLPEFQISDADKLAEVEKEIAKRWIVFPRLVAAKKMKRGEMQLRIAIMVAIRDELRARVEGRLPL